MSNQYQSHSHGHVSHRDLVGYVDMATGVKGTSAAGTGNSYLSMTAGRNYVDQV